MNERERFEAWAKARHNEMQIIKGEYTCPFTSELWEVWQAACPEGWQCVPKELTDDMTHSGCAALGDCKRLGECHMDCHCSPAPAVYQAMILAAPNPPY